MTIAPQARKVPPITLTTRLRLAREWRELEQQEIADELGISRATVSNYETGKTSPGKLQINAWAVVCDVDVEWLKTGTEQVNNTPDGAPSRNVGPAGIGPATFTVEYGRFATVTPIRELIAA
jgi:transcriptional regulator with XRE-family HTH domain